jgi:hypothetical protein
MTTAPDDPATRLLPGDPGWVDDGRLWSAAEVERLTPEQRAELSRQRHQPITDLSTLDPKYVERIRETGRRLVEEWRGKAPG